MQLLRTTKEFVMFPFTGPVGQEVLETYGCWMAIVPESGGEPEPGDWKEAAWLDHEVSLKYTEGDYPEGNYLVYGKLYAPDGSEAPAMLAGRLRIGDPRS